ncbi:MAG: alpha/beta fold hydrolase, partial [Bryobacteraceae bacterium]
SFDPPRTETEKRLARIWSSVLKLEAVGIREDFFALGGDSLRAVALATEIEKAFGKRLPAAVFLPEPTIEALARRLAEDGSAVAPSCLVPLQPSGGRTPLFCVHASPGTVLLYRQLAGRLAPDQPVHGLQAVGLDGDQAPLTTVGEMAAHYIEAIHEAHLAGPYSLLGHCQGAYIALEMAVQLQERGESVGFLGVVSTDATAREPSSVHGHFQRHWARLSRLTARQKWGYLAWRLDYRWQRVRQAGAELLCRLWLACGRPLPPALLRQRIDELNHRAGAAYRPRAFRGRITYFHGDGDPSLEAPAFWERLASEGVDVLKVPGRGAGVLREPHAGTLARTLRECLPDSPQSSVAQ